MSTQTSAHFAISTLCAAVQLALWGWATPALAEEQLDAVIVTGTRASLQKSLDRKRDSALVQDSISATELGRFPDDNVADSLSHITGVSITRSTGGEGLHVGVRGLGSGYSLVTLNNRILATDTAGRDFAFDVLPSDVISGADVLKSAQASEMEGAIGGLVNLRTARPFDQPGMHGALRVEGDRNTMTKLNGSKVSGVWSNTFADNTMGFLVGAVLSKRKVRTDSMNYNTYDLANPGSYDLNGDGNITANEQNLIGSCCIAFGSTFEDKKRNALSGTFEWKPNEGFKMAFDAIYTKLDAPQVGYNQAYFVQHAPGATASDPGRWSDVVAKDGLITSMTVHDLVPEIANITVDRVVTTNQFGWNGEWKATPALTLTSDIYQSNSKRLSGGNDSFVVGGIAGANTGYWSVNDNGLPNIRVQLEDGRDLGQALAAGQLGDANYGPHYVGLNGEDIRDRINGASFGGKLAINAHSIDLLHFGLSYTDRRKTRDFVGNDWTGGSCQYCDQYATTFSTLGGGVVRTLTLPNFMQGSGGNFPTSFVAFDVPAYLNALRSLNGQPNPNAPGTFYDFNNTLPQRDPVQSYVVEEKTGAAYLQADLSGESWFANVGVRIVNTRTRASTAYNQILSVDDPTPNIPTSSPTVVYSDATPTTESGSYTKLLPSANWALWLDKTLQLRLGAAQVMARPGVDQLAPTRSDQSINRIYTLTIAGNPQLKPVTANQADVSLEWYYQPNSAVTVAVFDKQIKNFITTKTTTGVDIGVPGQLYTVVQPVNGDKGSALGLELGWQHLFDNGFGLRAQHTQIRTKAYIDGAYVGELEGVAPSTSSLAFLYERGPVGLNVSFDHTSKYTVNSSTEAGLPNKAHAMLWVTASASYEVTKNFKVVLEGKNLSNAVYRSDLGRADASYGFATWGRSYTLGAALKF